MSILSSLQDATLGFPSPLHLHPMGQEEGPWTPHSDKGLFKQHLSVSPHFTIMDTVVQFLLGPLLQEQEH